MATTQGFQFRSDDQHSVAGTNLWEGLVRQDKAEKLNNVYYYKQQENKQSNKDQLSVIEPSNSIKEGVDIVFEQNPKLQRIGNKQLYSQYLDTIFPDSKVKDIVYHFSNVKIDKPNKEKFSLSANINRRKGFFGISRNINPGNNFANIEGSIPHAVLFNMKNPDFGDFSILPPVVAKDETKDSAIIKQRGDINYYSVFEPEQIYILGSKQDIEGFKDYVNTNQAKQSDITTNFEQYFPDYAYLNGDERQVFIKGVESGDITITCTK